MTMIADRLCTCGHWTEEHNSDGRCTTCEVAAALGVPEAYDGMSDDWRCESFVIEPEQYIMLADRGSGMHATYCNCVGCLVDVIDEYRSTTESTTSRAPSPSPLQSA